MKKRKLLAISAILLLTPILFQGDGLAKELDCNSEISKMTELDVAKQVRKYPIIVISVIGDDGEVLTTYVNEQ